MVRESPVAFYERQVRRANRRARLGLVGWLVVGALAFVLVCWALAGCGGTVKNADAASALDVARRFEFAICESGEIAPEDQALCDWAYPQLRRLEPGMEEALAKHAALKQAWAMVKPYAVAVVQQALPLIWPWILARVPALGIVGTVIGGVQP